MRKPFLILGFTVLVLFTLIMPHTASAQLLAGAQVGYGSTDYQKVLGKEVPTNTEWSSTIWAKYHHNDLLFTGLYQGALGLKDSKENRNLVQVGAKYRVLQEEMMNVYGGLGYQFINNRFENPNIESGKRSTLNGNGFIGQVLVEFDISEQLQATASFTANPWLQWAFGQSGITDSNIKSGSSFVFQLDILYELNSDLGLYLGLLGGSYRVPEFATKGATQANYKNINLGVTHRF